MENSVNLSGSSPAEEMNRLRSTDVPQAGVEAKQDQSQFLASYKHVKCTVAISVRHPRCQFFTVFALFVVVSTAIAVSIVCSTESEKKKKTCAMVPHTINAQPFSIDAHPSYIVAYDFNNDKKLDIAVANTGSHTVGVYLARGNGRFANEVTYITGDRSMPAAIAIGDFNGDQQWDIAVANLGTHTVGILLGSRDGTFMPGTTVSLGSSRPIHLAVGEFNHDGKLDLAVVNRGTNIVGVLFGHGDGTFTDQEELCAEDDSLPQAIVAGYLDNDTHADLVVANSGTHHISIFLGDGDGTFPRRTRVSTGINSRPYALVLADVDDDARVDIVVANSGTDTISILFGDDIGKFGKQAIFPAGKRPISVTTGDFNHDQRLDILVASNGSDTVGVFLGLTNGRFGRHTPFRTGADSSPYSVVSGDFDNDGWSDAAVVTYRTNIVVVLLALPSAAFYNQQVYAPSPTFTATGIAAGRFSFGSGGGIAVIDGDSGSLRIFSANSSGYLFDQQVFVPENIQLIGPIATGDFNNDTFDDLFVPSRSNASTAIILLFGDGHGAFLSYGTLYRPEMCSASSVRAHDVNGDHRLDIVVLCSEDRLIYVMMGYGNGSFTDAYLSSTDSQPSQFVLADLDGNGHVDIAVTYATTDFSVYGAIGILSGNGAGLFSNEVWHSTGYYPLTHGIEVGDFNNDGKIDIVVANTWNNNLGIFFGYGNSTFREQRTFATGIDSHVRFVIVGDFNNDSRADLVFDHEVKNGVVLWLGQGNGTFVNQAIYSTSASTPPTAIVAVDMNGDAQLDLFVANTYDHNIGVLFGFAYAQFTYASPLQTGSSTGPYSVALADFNEDGRLDFVVANYITDDIGVFLQDVRGDYPVQNLYMISLGASPTSVAVDRLDNDEYLDVAVANSGIDSVTIFFGNGNGSFNRRETYDLDEKSNPLSIATGDFNGDHQTDLIVANHDQDSVQVLLQYQSASFAPQVLYSTGDGANPSSFAVGDLNNDQRIDIVVTNNGKSNVGVLLGKGDGSFSAPTTFSPEGEFFPVQVAVVDLNADGDQDIAILDNANFQLYIAMGNGTGKFAISARYGTGYDSWPGAMATGYIDGDRWPDVVVCNRLTDQLLIFFADANGSLRRRAFYALRSGSRPDAIVVADMNNDNVSDCVVANTNLDSISIIFGYGNGSFSSNVLMTTGAGSHPNALAVHDFDGNGYPDIVVTNPGADSIAVISRYAEDLFWSSLSLFTGTGSEPNSLAVGDVNHDGRADILVANALTSNVGLILGYTKGTFFKQVTHPTVPDGFTVNAQFADVSNDGLLDVVVCNRNDDSIGVLLAITSKNEFLRLPSLFVGFGSQPTHIVTGHFNNDTFLDVAIANYGFDQLRILFGSGVDEFPKESEFYIGDKAGPYWITPGDVNQDGCIDLIVALRGYDSIAVFLGDGNGTFSNYTTFPTGFASQPSSIAIGDFNNDTIPDLAVANSGSNDVGILIGYGNGSFAPQREITIGFGSRPIALVAADVNKDNLTEIIVANSGDGTMTLIVTEC